MQYTLQWAYFTKYILFTCAGYLKGTNIYRVTDSLVITEMLRVQRQWHLGGDLLTLPCPRPSAVVPLDSSVQQ